MGKTYKDQNKYERKRKQRESEEDMLRDQKRKPKKHAYDEIIPDEDELDPYELLDYEEFR